MGAESDNISTSSISSLDSLFVTSVLPSSSGCRCDCFSAHFTCAVSFLILGPEVGTFLGFIGGHLGLVGGCGLRGGDKVGDAVTGVISMSMSISFVPEARNPVSLCIS